MQVQVQVAAMSNGSIIHDAAGIALRDGGVVVDRMHKDPITSHNITAAQSNVSHSMQSLYTT